jgi:hypothetical protein
MRVVEVHRRKKRSFLGRILRRGGRADVEELTQKMARQKEKQTVETYELLRRTLFTDIISPSSVQVDRDWIKVDDKYNRILAVVAYPHEVELGWMQELTRLSYAGKGSIVVSMHIHPIPKTTAERMLEQEYLKIDTEREKARLQGVPGDRTAGVAKRAIDQDIRDIALGREKFFFVSLYIMIEAENLQHLDVLTKRVINKLDGLNLTAKKTYMRMDQGLRSVMPIGVDELGIKKAMTTSALAACNLLSDASIPIEDSGVFFGVTEDYGTPVIIDPFGPNFTNANGLVLAGSGGGKSFFVKLYAIRQLLQGVDILIVDPSPEGEYRDITQAQQGSWIPLSHQSDAVINIFDLFGGSLRDKLISLKAISRFLVPDLSEAQAAMLGECYVEIYRARGITDDPRTWGNEPPTLGDAYRWLLAKAEEARESKDHDSLRVANTLIRRFKEFVEGTYKFLDQQSNIPGLDNRFVAFYLGELDAELRPLFSFLVMDYIYKRMKRSLKRKVLIMDEVWDLLRNRVASEYILRIVRTCRHHNLGLVLISQLVNDFLRDETGEAVMANTTWKLLLRQEDSAADAIRGAFRSLTREDVDWLVGLPSPKQLGYSLGMFVLGRQRTKIKIVADEYEYELVTTNPEELRRAARRIEEEQKIREEEARARFRRFDVNKGFYRLSELTDVQVDILREAGYRKVRGPTLGRGAGVYYMIRPPSEASQSDKHYITVKLIEEEILSYTRKVELYDTRLPDIIFTATDGRRVAIEVETGTNLKKKRQVLEDKLEILKAYDDWFFVCDERDKAAYSKWGPAYNRSEVVDKIKEYFM